MFADLDVPLLERVVHLHKKKIAHEPQQARARPDSSFYLARLSDYDLFIFQEELGAACLGPADDRQQARYLFARHQSESSAFRAGEHRPVRIVGLAHVAGVL